MAPKHRFRKFVVVSNRQRYEELVAQRGETSVWYRRPIPGFDVSDPEVFSLEQFTIDSVDVAFQRHADSTSQVYVADLGDEVIRAGKPVVVAFRFRTRTRQQGHVVHIDIDRPTRGLDIEFHYGDAAVAEARMLDLPRSVREDVSKTIAVLRRCATATTAGCSPEPAWSSSGAFQRPAPQRGRDSATPSWHHRRQRHASRP